MPILPSFADRRRGYALKSLVLFTAFASTLVALVLTWRLVVSLPLYVVALVEGAALIWVVSGWRMLLAAEGLAVGLYLVSPLVWPVYFLRSAISSNPASAIASLRTLVTAEEQYKSSDGEGRYAGLEGLQQASPPFIDSVLSSGTKSGYSFVGADDGGVNFTFHASPLVWGKTGTRSFFVDATGVIRSNPAGPATRRDRGIEGEPGIPPPNLTVGQKWTFFKYDTERRWNDWRGIPDGSGGTYHGKPGLRLILLVVAPPLLALILQGSRRKGRGDSNPKT